MQQRRRWCDEKVKRESGGEPTTSGDERTNGRNTSRRRKRRGRNTLFRDLFHRDIGRVIIPRNNSLCERTAAVAHVRVYNTSISRARPPLVFSARAKFMQPRALELRWPVYSRIRHASNKFTFGRGKKVGNSSWRRTETRRVTWRAESAGHLLPPLAGIHFSI